jgi:hypothetical protein
MHLLTAKAISSGKGSCNLKFSFPYSGRLSMMQTSGRTLRQYPIIPYTRPVCVYVCVYVCMYVCVCMCVCMYACSYMACMCMSGFLRGRLQAEHYANTQSFHTRVLYVCIYVCMYARVYVCLYVYERLFTMQISGRTLHQYPSFQMHR